MKYDIVPESTACFTGHRNLRMADLPEIRSRVAGAISQAYENGYRTFLCGGARGFDTLAALEVLNFRDSHPDIRLVIAVPCSTQTDRWTEEDRNVWQYVCDKADDVNVLSESYYNGCMQARNRYMVDASSLCLCYLVRFEGGTWSTVRYALHRGLLLMNLAMPDKPVLTMREKQWNCIYTSRSVSENAHTVHLHLSPLQKRTKMRMSRFSCARQN